jgi:O-antigen ligase
LSVSWHSHNAFLQIWSEAGAIGAAILLVFGLLVMRSIRRRPQPVHAALFATFSSCAMIAATGYSAFAPWLSASFALATIFGALATAMAEARTSVHSGTVTSNVNLAPFSLFQRLVRASSRSGTRGG